MLVQRLLLPLLLRLLLLPDLAGWTPTPKTQLLMAWWLTTLSPSFSATRTETLPTRRPQPMRQWCRSQRSTAVSHRIPWRRRVGGRPVCRTLRQQFVRVFVLIVGASTAALGAMLCLHNYK